MPYRMGRGDYPRGGFFGDLAHIGGGIIKGAVTGFTKLGPLGAVIGAAAGGAGGIQTLKNERIESIVKPIGGSSAGTPSQNDTSAEEIVRQHQVNVHKQQAKVLAAGSGGAGIINRPNAKLLGSGFRRRRTMRPTNVKALRRALRRAEGFKKIAMQTIRLIDPKTKGKKFGGFKRRKR